MIQSRPKLKNKKLLSFSFILLLAGVIIFPLSQNAGFYTVLIQIISIALIAVSLFPIIKYVIPDYLYTLEGTRFSICKVTKAQSVCSIDVDLNNIKAALLSEQEYKNETNIKRIYSFIKNPGDSSVKYLIFDIENEKYAIKFEPDNDFILALSKIIHNKHKTQNEE